MFRIYFCLQNKYLKLKLKVDSCKKLSKSLKFQICFLVFSFVRGEFLGQFLKCFTDQSLTIDHYWKTIWCIQLEQKIRKSRMLEEVSMYCGKDVELPIFFDRRKQNNNVHEISEHFS